MGRRSNEEGRGRVEKMRKGRDKLLRGRISVAAAGFGFVKIPGDSDDIFVPAKYVGDAMDGDLVAIRFLDERPRRSRFSKPAACVEEVLERGRTRIVGELIPGRKIRPLSRSIPCDIPVSGDLGDARKGDWIECVPSEPGKRGDVPFAAEFGSVIGKVGTVESDLVAVAREYDLMPPYTQEEEERILQIDPLEVRREDLTGLFTTTVDPADAKDYDDAISVSDGASPDEAVLGVHIADIAAWIHPDSEFDGKAFRRSFTSYLPGMTLPMLPRVFTRAASLTTDKVSLCNSVLMTVDVNTGRIKNSRRCHSLVKVDARVNFDELQEFIDGKRHHGWPRVLEQNLKRLVRLTDRMHECRKKTEEFIELATTHVRVLCDDLTKEVRGIRREAHRKSEALVEECMLAANVEVAKELSCRGIPGLYRVHPEPSEDKLAEFAEFMRETFGMSTGDLRSRKACNHFLQKLPDDQRRQVITDAFLRSLPRASYSSRPSIHFGLGKGLYSHFTSPIRRYTDLAVHQQLWCRDYSGELRDADEFARIAETCSEREARNDEAYYAANDRMKLHYMKKVIAEADNDCFEGIIQRVASYGISVSVPELAVNGIVEARHLGGDFFRRSGKMSSKAGHRSYKCGDFIFVRLESVDFVRGTAYFRPVQ